MNLFLYDPPPRVDLNCGGKIIVESTELVGTLPGDERKPQRKRPLMRAWNRAFCLCVRRLCSDPHQGQVRLTKTDWGRCRAAQIRVYIFCPATLCLQANADTVGEAFQQMTYGSVHSMLVFYPWHKRLALLTLGEQPCQKHAPTARLRHTSVSSVRVQSHHLAHNAATRKRPRTE